jgi:predicted ABC-type sugar transport system permease subunit
VAGVLKARNLPFIVTTGDATIVRGAAYAGAPILRKPFTLSDLEGALAGLC